jgi:hypothetical protein
MSVRFMSIRNAIVLLLALSTLTFLVACGNGNGSSIATAPPTGAFGASNLNGTYVFTVSGSDGDLGAPYAMTGTFTANGSGGITGGAVDITDPSDTTEFPDGPIFDASIGGNSSYRVGVDGRGQATLDVTSVSGLTITLDFVLANSSQGVVTEFDSNATGSGTLDLQTANTTPTGSYAFSLSGASGNSAWATAGNFTLTGSTIAGFGDLNEAGLLNYPDEALTGSLTLGPSATPSTLLTIGTSGFSGTFDVFAIDATHLKFIEMDGVATLSGDAYSQTSNTVPTGNLAFTISGLTNSSVPVAIGGYMLTNGSGGITGTQDFNIDGSNVSNQSAPSAFTATYTVDPNDAGRYNVAVSTFAEGTSYVAYPSTGGLLLLEMDSSGISSGAAYLQTAGATFAATAQGYGLNLSGVNTSDGVEVDDIAEFSTNPTGSTVIGKVDENFTEADGSQAYAQLISGTYGTVDSNGRYGVGVTSNGTLEGGFTLTLYAVDGQTFPFVELDGGQVSTGVILLQNASATTPAVAHTHMLAVHPLYQSRAARAKKQ